MLLHLTRWVKQQMRQSTIPHMHIPQRSAKHHLRPSNCSTSCLYCQGHESSMKAQYSRLITSSVLWHSTPSILILVALDAIKSDLMLQGVRRSLSAFPKPINVGLKLHVISLDHAGYVDHVRHLPKRGRKVTKFQPSPPQPPRPTNLDMSVSDADARLSPQWDHSGTLL